MKRLAVSVYKQYNAPLAYRTLFRFCEEKKGEEKQEETPKQTEKQVKIDPKLGFEALLRMDSGEAKKRLQELHFELKDKFKEAEQTIKNNQNKIEILQTNQKAANEKIDDLRKNLKNQLEEVESVGKRLRNEKEQEKVFAITKFAKDLLDVQDNLERALENAKPEEKETSLFQGVTMTQKILEKTLGKYGVVKMKSLGEKFDPNLYEAMFQFDDPEKDPLTVAVVAQDGYMIGDRVLRAAKVGVVKER